MSHFEGRPVAVTCDCHPRLANALLPEMTDRLAAVRFWADHPDRATRLTMLRAKAAALGGLPEPVLGFMADHLHGNVRELEGALNSVIHLGRVTGRTPDVAQARAALADVLRHSVRVLRLPDVDRRSAGPGHRGERAAIEETRLAVEPSTYAGHVSGPQAYHGDLQRGRQALRGRSHSTVVAARKRCASGSTATSRSPWAASNRSRCVRCSRESSGSSRFRRAAGYFLHQARWRVFEPAGLPGYPAGSKTRQRA